MDNVKELEKTYKVKFSERRKKEVKERLEGKRAWF